MAVKNSRSFHRNSYSDKKGKGQKQLPGWQCIFGHVGKVQQGEQFFGSHDPKAFREVGMEPGHTHRCTCYRQCCMYVDRPIFIVKLIQTVATLWQ